MPLQPGTRLGPYEIVSLLGAGGMGEVYRARDVRLNRFIAAKVLPVTAALDPERRDRFEREAQAIAALNHPNIVTIHSVEEADGLVVFLTMELVEGRSLAESMLPGGVPIDRLLRVAIAVADALAAAHQKGITHRDLKPANIMIGDGEHQGRVKVLDFGLAKLTDLSESASASLMPTRPITGEGRILGTVAYMSPEQAEGKTIDSRSDLFSLGIILYEMATGQRPFAGETSISIIASIIRDTPPAVTELNAALPRDLGRIIRRALTKDPDRRYQTAKDLRNDLEELKGALESGEALTSQASSAGTIAGSPQVVPSAPAPAPASSDSQMAAALVKRHRGTAVGVAAVLLTLVAVTYFFAQKRQPAATPPAASGPTLQDLQITQLTTSGNAERPAISPDGRYVAYVQRDGNDDSLWIRQTATNSNVQIVRPEPADRLIGVTVTPDGNFIDLVRRRERQFALWRVPFLGGTPKKLFDDVHTPVGWSPDGTQVAFIRADPARGSSALIVADADGSHERALNVRRSPALFAQVTSVPFPAPRPDWSPDGRVIAVPGVDQLPSGRVLQAVFVDVPTGLARTIALPEGGFGPVAGAALGLAWLNSGSLVLTRASDTGSPSQLWRLSYPDGGLSRVTNDVNSYLRVSLTADRDSLVTMRSEVRGGVWMADGAAANGSDAVPLAPRIMSSDGIAWIGDRLLYVTTTNGPPAIVRQVPGGTPEEVVSNAVFPDVTPDGRTVVFTSAARDREIWKVNAEGGQPVKLADGNSHVVTPDGRSVLFLSSIGGFQAPWIVSLEGGAPRQIAKAFAGAVSLAVSPDGGSIAFWSQDENNTRTLLTCALPTCDAPKVLAAPPSQSRLRYTPDGRALAFLDSTATNIWLLPFAGGPPRQLTHFADGPTIGDFAWSRDGKRLAVSRSTVANDIILFKGLRR